MNLQMLLADAQDYYTDFSDNKGGKGKDKGEVVDATDPKNKEKMYQMLGW